MKRIGMVVVLALVATMTFAPFAFAQAQGEPAPVQQSFNLREPFTFSTTNPCTGEQITGEGTTHFMGSYRENASGGYIFQVHINTSGSGVSQSGAKYVLNGSQHESGHSHLDGTPNTYTGVQRSQLIRQGEAMPGDDFLFNELLFHLTVNANGEVTAQVVPVDEDGGIVVHQECR